MGGEAASSAKVITLMVGSRGLSPRSKPSAVSSTCNSPRSRTQAGCTSPSCQLMENRLGRFRLVITPALFLYCQIITGDIMLMQGNHNSHSTYSLGNLGRRYLGCKQALWVGLEVVRLVSSSNITNKKATIQIYRTIVYQRRRSSRNSYHVAWSCSVPFTFPFISYPFHVGSMCVLCVHLKPHLAVLFGFGFVWIRYLGTELLLFF